MKKLFAATLFILATGLFTNTYAQTSKVYGTFNFNAEDVSWEYESGTIKISKTKGKNAVAITFDQGGKIDLQDVKIKKNTITGSAQIEDTTIDVSMKVTKNQLEGTSTTSDGAEISFQGKRKKKVTS